MMRSRCCWPSPPTCWSVPPRSRLLGLLRASSISRILIKPFRVRDVIDTIDAMRERAAATAQ